MKPFVYSLILIVCASFAAQAQWTRQKTGTTYFNCVKFLDASTVLVGSNSGTLKSTDGGVTFGPPGGPQLTIVKDLFFFDANNGICVGSISGNSEMIFRTTNGGGSWTTVYSNSNGPLLRILNSVHFPTSTTGYAVGENGRILKSTNGGASWTSISLPTALRLNSVYFTSATTGYVAGDGVILSTTNGGSSWTTSSSQHIFRSVQFTSADTGFIAAEHGMLKTVDHGLTWTLKTVNRSDRFAAIKMINGSLGFACADNGIYKTENAGEFWALQPSSDFNGQYAAIDFADANTGVSVGFEGHMVRTSVSGSPVPKNDADLASAIFPGIDACPGIQNILFRIRNNGMNNLGSSVVHWKVNGVLQSPFIWTGNLLPDSTTPYLSLSYDFQSGLNQVVMWTESPNGYPDDDLANDTMLYDVPIVRLLGTYTIGGTNPDFTTIEDAISALTFYGPCGDVTFRIRNGSYVLPQTTISTYLDSLAANRKVVFESESGDPSQVIISTDGIGLNSIKHIAFRNLTLANPAGYTLISLAGKTQNISVTGCWLSAVTATGSFATEGIIEAPVAGNFDSLHFSHNTFTGGLYGIKINSSNPDTDGCYIDVSNNRLDSQLNTGISLLGNNRCRIVSNTISSTASGVRGISVYLSGLNMLISKNKILLDHGTGINIQSCNSPAASRTTISNNFIRVGNPQRSISGGITGVYFHASSNINFFHNTVVNKNSIPSGSFTSTSFFIDDTDTTRAPAFAIRNNIMSNEATNGTIYSIGFYNALNPEIDYLSRKVFSSLANNAYLQKTNAFAGYTTTTLFDLREWNTYDLDEQSWNIDPQIADLNDLHIKLNSSNYQLNGAAVALPEVTEDIDGNPRNLTWPDIGADEFETGSRDMAIAVAPFSGVFCTGSNPVNVAVHNFGNDTVTALRIAWKRNGVQQAPFQWSGVFLPGQKIDRLTIGNMVTGSTRDTIMAWVDSVNHAKDLVSLNDSVLFSGAPGGLSGTFTVGGTTPDYATLNAAVNDLKGKGVCGPVLFNVRPGTYNEQLLLKDIKGTDSVNTVVFTSENGDSNAVTIAFNPTSSASNYVIRFDSSVNYITLNKMTITCSTFQSGGFGYLVSIRNLSHHITISNCALKTTGSASNVQAYAISSENSSYGRLLNNYVSATYYGIQVSCPMLTLSRSLYNTVNGNVFINQKDWFIKAVNSTGIEIGNNTGSSTLPNPNSSNKMCLSVTNTFGYVRVVNNQFLSTTAQDLWMYFSNNRGSRNQRMLVGNNMCNSISFSQCAYIDMVNNSLYAVNSSAALSVSGTNFRILNNILVLNNSNSAACALSVTPGTRLDVLDHNCYYNPASNRLINYYYTQYTNLDTWKQNAFDAHSWNINPQFISTTNLHINVTNSGRLKKAGMGWESLSVDIDGQPKDLLHPDIGADEFVFNALNNDAGVIAIKNPIPLCSGTNPLWVQIRNYGKDTLRTATINCSINGNPIAPYSFSGQLEPFGSTGYINIGTYNFSSATNHTIRAFTSQPNSMKDSLTANDSILLGPVHTLLGGVYTVGGSSPHYATVALAVKDLVEYGICGPVEFRIRNGSYTESLLIPEIKGASAINTITFTGESMDSSLVQLKVNAMFTTDYVLKLDGANHMTFRYLTIWNDAFSAQGKNIWITNQSDSIAFRNCRIMGAFVLIEKTCNYLSFENNQILMRMQVYGAVSGSPVFAKGFTFRNNTIRSNDCLALSFYESGVLIEKNTLLYTLVANTGYSRGISLTGCRGPFTIRDNNIQGVFSPGIGIATSEASPIGERSRVYNNFISGSAGGITLDGSAGVDVAFNNIFCPAASNERYGMMLLPGLSDVNIINNNIVHNGSGGACIYLNDNDPFNPAGGSQFYSDFNNIYSNFAPVVYCITTVSPFAVGYQTVGDYTAAKNHDANSLSVDPLFTSDSNLHVNNHAIRNKGQQATWCTIDIDGDPRNIYQPDIGADEGLFIPMADLGNDSVFCNRDTIILSSTHHFNNIAYLWSTGDTTEQIKVHQSGIYWLRVSNVNGFHIDSVNITMSHLPANLLSLGNDSVGCNAIHITPNISGSSYQWSTGDTTSFINATSSGKYVLLLKHASGCYLSDTIQVTVYQAPTVNLGKDTNICSPGTLRLQASAPAHRYTWSTGDTLNSITISTPGTYSLRAINGNTCSAADTVTVTFSPKPVVNLGNDTTFCSGNKLQLNAGNPGSKYQWSTGDTTSGIQIGITGTYMLKVTDVMGCSSTDALVATVIATPQVNLGRDTLLCSGRSIRLAGGTGSKYHWSTGDTTSSILVSSAGSYVLRITNVFCSASDTVVVSIAPLPVVNLGADTTFCAGNTLVLDALNPGATYLWSTGNTTPTIAVNTTKKVSVRVTNTFGCAASDTIQVTVNPLPVASFTIDSSNSPVIVFTNHSTHAINYRWHFGDLDTSSAISPGHTYVSSGTYLVKLKAGNACGLDSMTRTVTILTTGLNNSADPTGGVNIYPNPATNFVHVSLEDPLKTKLQVYDISGRRMDVPVKLAAGGLIIDSSPLSNGTYTVVLSNEEVIVVKKITIIR